MTLLKAYSVIIIRLCIFSIVKSTPCDHNIFCKGEILHAVQTSNLFPDCKTFVDMKLKFDKDKVKNIFDQMMPSGNKPVDKISKFVNQCFDPPGSEFEEFTPSDWKKTPTFLNNIENPNYKYWATQLHILWMKLGRNIKPDVLKNPDNYSIIYVPNPVIIPGGRFREFYYWDSYWIILGLLHSEMFTTVKGMLENFLTLVDNIGFVPNGGRIYYKDRSQPPLLIPMVKIYYDITKDNKFIQKNIKILEKEFQFWMDKRTLSVEAGDKEIKVARYYVKNGGPRPESYREDLDATHHLNTDKEKDTLYSNLKSTCESGWDFSSRWYINQGENKGGLSKINTNSIVPVDLNAILCGNAEILSDFYKIMGREDKEKYYKNINKQWKEALMTLLWDEHEGVWFDYDIVGKKKRKYYYISNVSPLWTKCYDEDNKEIIPKVVTYLTEKINIESYIGGIPTSLEESGEQWDFPNAWPPLVHMLITGLRLTKQEAAMDLARNISTIWLNANYKGYTETKEMFEKYDTNTAGAYGGGGEYEIQLGFGWTNGVCLDLIYHYGSKLVDNTALKKSSGKLVSPTISPTKLVSLFVILYQCTTGNYFLWLC